ncbi:uncharacterized protein LOC110649676 [Hevea brasiliensis]|uniref:uncharacterized protein LOC110649676 n=1 Tax=Hevea brasiliensis TaxID=3981 RepID=UPI0025E36D96|nr:uncharacterized protein LOC110649676 [Hevea brasiliensis]
MVGVSSSTIMAEKISCYCALLMATLLVFSCCEVSETESEFSLTVNQNKDIVNKICDEIYMVREGETLHTISEKCGDPYIVEENPHIHDPDDVFPGLVIKITPFNNSRFELAGYVPNLEGEGA